MNIRELSQLTGTPERQIRYMIAEGFVPPPEGGRAHADYGETHVAAIQRYSELRSQGLPPQAIRVLLAGATAAPFPVSPGVWLHLDPEIAGAVDGEALADRVRQAVAEYFKEPRDAEHQSRARKRSR
jgi:DNA-binding transcriptional MerR regulator